jgi:hypothetical protein
LLIKIRKTFYQWRNLVNSPIAKGQGKNCQPWDTEILGLLMCSGEDIIFFRNIYD